MFPYNSGVCHARPSYRPFAPFAAKSLYVSFGVLVSAGAFGVATASAQPLSLFAAPQSIAYTSAYAPEPAPLISAAPQSAPNVDDADVTSVRDPRLARQIVSYQTKAAAGTVVIDTGNTLLYYVLGTGKAVRYGIGVGREGFTWSGTQTVSRKAEWPDWLPSEEMIARQPYLPRFMAGGEGNSLGARAIYLGDTMYRIHGPTRRTPSARKYPAAASVC